MFGLKSFLKVIGFTLIIVGISLTCVEVLNTNVNSVILKAIIDKSVQLSADYFNQETYKNESKNSGDVASLTGADGASVSGHFYDGSTPEEIYNKLYRNSSEFMRFANTYAYMWSGLNHISTPGINNLIDEQLVTPLNMGVTYLDRNTVQRICRWQLGAILMNGRDTLLRSDSYGEYVLFNGFRVYINNFIVNSIDYELVSITSTRFKQLTNMEHTSLGLDGADTERQHILVASINYTLPIVYEGVTFLGNLIDLSFDPTLAGDNTAVEGVNGTVKNDSSNGIGLNLTPGTISGGGVDGTLLPDGETMATSGSIKYYIIR